MVRFRMKPFHGSWLWALMVGSYVVGGFTTLAVVPLVYLGPERPVTWAIALTGWIYLGVAWLIDRRYTP